MSAPATMTVIIPVFNVADYLRAALDSLRAQTFPQWTAICVDDGSTDGSGAILDDYAARDPRIEVVHQPNAGVSAARNVALARAQGDVVLFMDPDDVVEPDWLARMRAGLGEAEAVLAGYSLNGITVLSADQGAVYKGAAVRTWCWRAFFGYRLRDIPKVVLPGGLWRQCRREMAGVWRLAVRRGALRGARFDVGFNLNEDAMFLARLAQGLQSLAIAGDCGYQWLVRPQGAMTRQLNEHFLENKFKGRDIRRRIDPEMTHWRGTFLLSALELLWKRRSLRLFARYLLGRPMSGNSNR